MPTPPQGPLRTIGMGIRIQPVLIALVSAAMSLCTWSILV